MAYSALSPVSEAVYALLQNATLLATLTGGMHDDVPQNITFPCGWFEVSERSARGLGTGGLPEVALRTHVYSEYGGMKEAQEANRLIVSLLRDVALTVTGYTMCGTVFWDETVTLPDEAINGVKCHEVVSMFRIYVEE